MSDESFSLESFFRGEPFSRSPGIIYGSGYQYKIRWISPKNPTREKAYFDLDRPESNLPLIEPVVLRLKDKKKKVWERLDK